MGWNSHHPRRSRSLSDSDAIRRDWETVGRTMHQVIDRQDGDDRPTPPGDRDAMTKQRKILIEFLIGLIALALAGLGFDLGLAVIWLPALALWLSRCLAVIGIIAKGQQP